MMERATLVLDVETRLLASEVASRHAEELAGGAAWERPDLFGFACGVAVDAATGDALRYGPDEAPRMIEDLAGAERTVSYNGAAFDLGVLEGYGDVSGIRARHVDLRSHISAACQSLAREGERLRTGGLDALARANGIGAKIGSGTDAPALYREGRIEELLDYCEADARLTTRLYEVASTGRLRVELHAIREGERVELDPVLLDLRDALTQRRVRRYVFSAPAWQTGIACRVEATEEELPDRIVQYITETAPGFADAETSEDLERLEAGVVVSDWGAGPWPRNHHQRGEVVPGWDE